MPSKDDNQAFAEAFLLGEFDKAQSIYATGGVDLNRPDDDNGFTYLHTACRLGLVDAARWLLSEGVEVDAPVAQGDEHEVNDELGATPLMVTLDSIALNKRALIEMLLEAGADLHKVDELGRGVVHRALEASELLDLVLELGADPDVRTKGGETPLMRAALTGNEQAIERLREAGASEGGMRDIELQEAVEAGVRDKVAACLANGANVNFQSDGTALTTAAGAADIEMMRLLLDAGADIDLPETDDPDGDFNPLLCAAYDGQLDIVRFLLDAGANSSVSNHGISALDYAKMGKAEGRKKDRPWNEVIKMLREAGKGAAATLRGEPVENASVEIVEALNALLPEATNWSRFAGEGVEIIESDFIDDAELLRRELPAMQGVARSDGFSLAVITYSLCDAEPRLAELKDELGKAAASNVSKVFDAWEASRLQEPAEVDDDGFEDDDDWSQRLKVLAALTEVPTASGDGSLRVDAGHLVLCAGSPAPIPIAYRFGGWNSAPQPYEMGLVLQHWHEAFGAELISIDRSTLAVRLTEPLCSVDQVRAAAREAGLFCDESESARDDIRTVVSACWSFWWD